ncbi:MAG: bifunctional UDP-N-acetylglucosamine diphosphorylase/glucosamine-1-phosphate N-acetyltransferase GlmU [Anaerolineales bacterium]|nr:bifunctional UDP-N-acetylglucosamine diphosphorylase/glucosamine-1-phosphate N-acetyltransferase GlmU [Anaerolineales bacterium]
MKSTAVLLAAGQGTRMKSNLPKVLHPVAGKPMIGHALRAARQATTETPIVVVGHGAEEVTRYLGGAAQTVVQNPPLGTGHAVMQAEALLKGKADLVVVCYADMPLLRGETLQRLVETQQKNRGALSLLTVMAENPRGFGRVIRGADGALQAIVEEYVATPEQLRVKELNVGGYCFDGVWLWDALRRIPQNPQKGEYYLTDIVEIAVRDGLAVQATLMDDLEETIGVNTRVHLSEVETALRRRINQAHMLDGVTLIDPAATYIEADVTIGRDTVIYPNTFLRGATEIGAGNQIGPNTIIRDSKIGDRCKILASDLEGATLENDVEVGPFARLRKGAHLGDHVHMGNFGEVKDSRLRAGVKMGHFSYIGNAQIGANTNIGAGTITCNFDGERKHPTEIGEDVFIGSDTMLVAPLKLGDGARTGAGAVVTKDVAEDTLAVGMPARAIRKLERRKKKS